jgi:ferrochelatase
MTSRKALILVNLGTPDSPSVADVRKYLKQFLMDPFVIDIPFLFRWILIHGIILRFRPRKSAKAYSTIWTQEGSPLLVNTKNFTEKFKAQFGSHFTYLDFAMRYGNPSISSRLDDIKKLDFGLLDEIFVAPLYPQFADSSTGTVIKEVFDVIKEKGMISKVSFLPPFFDEPEFIQSLSSKIATTLKSNSFKPDHILFSYHGLPVRHITKLDRTQSHCYKSQDCCEKWDSVRNTVPHCYKAQCLVTTKKVGSELKLETNAFSSSFQSRLGQTKWIEPYTDEVLVELAQKGVKNLAVICPAFVSDCLETIEEIGDRAQHDFQKAGGEKFLLIPCLNDDPNWVNGFKQILDRASKKTT